MEHDPENFLDMQACTLKSGSINLRKDGIEVNAKKGARFILYESINDIELKQFMIIKASLIIETRDSEICILKVRRSEITLAQGFKHAIDNRCKINAFEVSDAFARSPFINSFSVLDSIIILIILPLTIAPILIATLLFSSVPGAVIGTIIIIFSIFILSVTARFSMGGIEGKCPICGKPTKSNRRMKFFYCVKCKEKIYIKRDYFEF